jgi:predicted enzyme related to lactoylglutathione lyase
MRLQLAINVKDLDAAVEFYSKVFGVEVNKRKPGYANFAIDQPPLKLVLFEAPDAVNQLNHLGVEVFDDADVDAAAERISAAGLAPELQEEQTCCFAKQNKAIVYDPDGTMLEWYRLIEDSDSFFAETSCSDTNANADETGSCCAQTGSCCAA